MAEREWERSRHVGIAALSSVRFVGHNARSIWYLNDIDYKDIRERKLESALKLKVKNYTEILTCC